MVTPWDHIQAQSVGLYAPQVSPVNTVSGQVFGVLSASAQLNSKAKYWAVVLHCHTSHKAKRALQ